jgi:Kef-type K+ transport system membrane component KefB
VLGVVAVRLLAKVLGTVLASPGSGLRLSQALWTGCAMSPMSSVALLLASQFALASQAHGAVITGVALPCILLMEVVGAVIATVALRRAGESGRDHAREAGDSGRGALE